MDTDHDNKATHRKDTENLLERFFAGETTPEENMILSCEAEVLADKAGKASREDEADEGLRLIAALDGLGRTPAFEPPADLEDRLERHISRLAYRSRRRRRLRWLSCAATGALVLSLAPSLLRQESADPVRIAAADPSCVLTDTSAAPRKQSMPHEAVSPAPLVARLSDSGAGEDSPKEKRAMTPSPAAVARHLPDRKPVSDPIASLSPLASLSEQLDVVSPALTAAYVDPAQIALQPLSTISQTIDDVYESIDMVTRALSGMSYTFETASEGLALIYDMQ